jgi:hypothetical protein
MKQEKFLIGVQNLFLLYFSCTFSRFSCLLWNTQFPITNHAFSHTYVNMGQQGDTRNFIFF